MGKYKGIYWPALIGLGHIPKVKKEQFYDQKGRYKRVTGDEKMAFYIRHPVFRGNQSLFFNMDGKNAQADIQNDIPGILRFLRKSF